MAKQLKKIRRNLKPQAGGTNTEKLPEKKGKDTFLLIMIALTFFIAFIGWSEMTWLNRSMYGSLAASLLLIYGYKQGNFGEKEKLWMTRASMFFIALSFALFAAICYYQYFA